MKRHILLALMMLAWLQLGAVGRDSTLTMSVHVGYAVGGNMPVGLPASVRKLNEYRLKPNLSLGVSLERRIAPAWALASGLWIENKAMEIDVNVKSYHTTIVRGGEMLDGYYTGRQHTRASQLAATVPLQGVLTVARRFQLSMGPYLSFLLHRRFTGYVYDGYLRTPYPTGDKVEMGTTQDERGTYDFSHDMRRLQLGAMVGANWQAGARYGLAAHLEWGLTGTFKGGFHTIEQTLYPIFGTISFYYQLNI